MRSPKHFAVLLLLIFAGSSFAQFSGENSMLVFPPQSAQINSYGAAGVALQSDDEYAAFYNPAQLGYFSMKKNVALQIQPYHIELGNGREKNLAFAAGYKFKRDKKGEFAYSIGFGYIRSVFEPSYDRIDIIPGTAFNEYSVDTYSFGLGVTYYYVDINLGYSLKNLIADRESGEDNLDLNASDFGVLVNVPVIKMINDDLEFVFNRFTSFTPVFDIGTGYAVKNIGDEYEPGFLEGKAPLSRNATLGFSFTVGGDLHHKYIDIEALRLSWVMEASDPLVKENENGILQEDPQYQGPFGDINIFENVIGGSASDKIMRHRGVRMELFETLGYGFGFFDAGGTLGGETVKYETSGVSVRAKGLFKLIQLVSKNNFTEYLAQHVDIQYKKSVITSDNPDIEFEGISLVLGGY